MSVTQRDPSPPALAARTAGADAAGVRLVGVRHRYGPAGTTPALDVSDLAIPQGSLTAVVGPSGCGKSTLLSVVAGLLTPTEGRVLVGGDDVTAAAPGQRDLAMVFQDFALYPHLTVAGNVGFGLRIEARHARRAGGGPDRAEIDRRVAEVCGRFGLGELLDRRPAQLSGGQRQRVALARAIVRARPLLLLDEPLSSLDAQLRQHARSELVRLHRELGVTMVMVTHDQSEALSVATHLVVMREGRVVQAAAPVEVYRRPVDEFTATFVGSPAMNVLARDGVRRGWRPSDATVLDPRGGDPERLPGDLLLDGVVDVVEFAGHERLVHCRDADGDRWVVGEALTPTAVPCAAGDALRVRVPPAALHHFDPATGHRRGD